MLMVTFLHISNNKYNVHLIKNQKIANIILDIFLLVKVKVKVA